MKIFIKINSKKSVLKLQFPYTEKSGARDTRNAKVVYTLTRELVKLYIIIQ